MALLAEAGRDFTHSARFRAVWVPLWEMPVAEVIFKVKEQFLEARACGVDEAQFSL